MGSRRAVVDLVEEGRAWRSRIGGGVGTSNRGVLEEADGLYGDWRRVDGTAGGGAGLRCQRKAAGLGHVGALVRLGQLHEMGDGVRLDEEKATQLYLRAAELGHGPAMERLGMIHMAGDSGLW
jgi:hypothetical protein